MIPKHSRRGYEQFERIREIGEYDVLLPEPPPIEEIANYDKPKADQIFTPLPFPDDFDRWTKHEKKQYYLQEQDKIDYGYWFFNNGKLEYVTGIHYFYISYWKIKMLPDLKHEPDENDGDMNKLRQSRRRVRKKRRVKKTQLPKFVDTDQDFFHLWDHVEFSDKIGGLVYVTNRRDGKSYKGGVIAYITTILNPDSHSGIQSKTDKDAKSVLKKIVDSWKRLPVIFRPADNGETNPQKSLRFEPDSRKDTKTELKNRKRHEKYINSLIDIGSVNEFFYDGQDLIFYMMDEAGKTTKADVHETQQVVKETLVDGTDITGKMYVTSTVEEMEKKGGKNLFLIWDEANPSKVDDFGMTPNSLIRYFKPAYKGLRGKDENGVPFINKYGHSDWKRAKAYLEKKRLNLSGNSLLSYMRKYPFTIDEAFQLASTDCIFKRRNIETTLKWNETNLNETNLVRGNFEFVEGTGQKEVEFHIREDGNWLITGQPEESKRNQYRGIETNTKDGFQHHPTVYDYVMGIDPIDNRETTDSRSSNAGIHVFKKYNPMASEDSMHAFVAEYVHRPDDPIEFYNDALKASIFYSAMTLIEKNKYGIINHYIDKGYKGFLMKRPDPTHTAYSHQNTKDPIGIPLNSLHAREYLVNQLKSYIYRHIGYDMNTDKLKTFMPFNKTLKDWLTFNPAKWTDFDATVSSGLALIAAEAKIEQHEDPEEIVPGLLETYQSSGNGWSKKKENRRKNLEHYSIYD